MGDHKIKIPFNKPFIAGKELYYIAQAVLVESHLSGDGPFTKRCQQWFEQRLGCLRALLTNSCTAALEMCAILCDIAPGDEVIMPSFTFVSTANAFVLRGGVPIFLDIRPETLNLDERLIESAITSRTKAIVPVHYAGVLCRMDEILEVATRHKLFVVEDAAQSLFSTYKGHHLGTLGDLGCLSFHETKNIISGEGGAILINNKRLVERAEIIREKGTNRSQFFRGEVDKYTWIDIGSSYLASELIGAFLYAQLEECEKIIAARCRIFRQYHQLLSPLENEGIISLPFVAHDNMCNGQIFYIITKSLAERIKLTQYMKESGVIAIFHYVPLHSSPAGMKYGRVAGDLKITEDVSNRLLRLPLYYEMSDAEVDKVVDLVKNFYKGKR